MSALWRWTKRALLAATQIFPAGTARLILPKTTEQGQLTMAVALSDRIIL